MIKFEIVVDVVQTKTEIRFINKKILCGIRK